MGSGLKAEKNVIIAYSTLLLLLGLRDDGRRTAIIFLLLGELKSCMSTPRSRVTWWCLIHRRIAATNLRSRRRGGAPSKNSKITRTAEIPPAQHGAGPQSAVLLQYQASTNRARPCLTSLSRHVGMVVPAGS